jgi:hypothetical protein
MGSPLYAIKVLKIEDKIMEIQLALEQDTLGRLGDDCLALRLLCGVDSTYKFNDNYDQVPNSFLGDAISFEESLDEDWIENNAIKFIEDVKVVSLNNFPFEKWDYENWNDCLKSNHVNDDGLDFSKLAKDHPEGILAIKVTDKRYFDCFKIGMTFKTTAYSSIQMREEDFNSIGKWIFSE